MPCHSHQMGQSIRGPKTLLSYVLGGFPRISVVGAVTNTSTSLRGSTRGSAGREDIVVAVFDVRRAYFL